MLIALYNCCSTVLVGYVCNVYTSILAKITGINSYSTHC